MTLSLSFISVSAQETSPFTIGEIVTMRSKVLEEDRVLNIYLPMDYQERDSLPVVYVLDGSLNEDLIHIIGVYQFFELQFQLPMPIIVGIANVDRKRDFTFAPSDTTYFNDIPSAGGSTSFIRYLKKELIPYINGHYKTGEHRTLIGQSLGGLLATEVFLTETDLFTDYIIVSPSLWWDEQRLFEWGADKFSAERAMSCYVYLAVGGKEHPIMVSDAAKLSAYLRSLEVEDFSYDFLVMQDEDHATILHNAVYQALLQMKNNQNSVK